MSVEFLHAVKTRVKSVYLKKGFQPILMRIGKPGAEAILGVCLHRSILLSIFIGFLDAASFGANVNPKEGWGHKMT